MAHLVIEGDQVRQAGPAFYKPMLTGPDYLIVLYLLCDGTQDDLLHNLPWHCGHTERHVVCWVLLMALPADGHHFPCRRDDTVRSSLWPFTGLLLVASELSYTEEPTAGHSTQGVPSPVRCRGGEVIC